MTKGAAPALKRKSAFEESGFAATIDALVAQTQQLYLEDQVPWVVGYSGGKDSTAVLQIVWLALAGIPTSQRHKEVHVITTDTMVENPVVAGWVARSLDVLRGAAEKEGLPINPHRLTPAIADTFWVNLIGRGYPAPRPKFRWCTERLKIKPSNGFIRSVVRSHGEAILVLGTRKAESSVRAHRMTELETQRVRNLLSPNASLPNCLVYSPVENWTNDDVWTFLMQVTNPWGYSNKDLLTMYQGASPDGECPLVVDASTPSCGDSRFGCWTCTLVEKDKSMTAMIQNDEEKTWMLPLLELRNELDVQDDRHLRDFRRMNGSVQLFHGKTIPGPYTQVAREDWLKKLLEAQVFIRNEGPEYTRNLELITLPELEEIRRLWVVEKHEFEDHLPGIYEQVTGEPYPGRPLDEHLPLGTEMIETLRELAGDDRLHFEMVRELLDTEQRHRAQARRAGLFESLEKAIRRAFYDNEEDATDRAHHRKTTLDRATSPGNEPDPLDLADGYVRPAQGEIIS